MHPYLRIRSSPSHFPPALTGRMTRRQGSMVVSLTDQCSRPAFLRSRGHKACAKKCQQVKAAVKRRWDGNPKSLYAHSQSLGGGESLVRESSRVSRTRLNVRRSLLILFRDLPGFVNIHPRSTALKSGSKRYHRFRKGVLHYLVFLDFSFSQGSSKKLGRK